MSYSGNMPDWHQYNPPQPGGSRAGSTSHPQNVNSHHFISSITPPALDGINLTTDRQQKCNDSYSRSYQSSGISQNCPTSSSLTTSGVHMSPNCHYSRPLMEPMDPLLTLNEPKMHRSSQMSFNPPSSHANNLTVNPSLGGLPSQTSPVAPPPLSPGSRQPCRLPCCDPTINYPHWEKYQHYQSNPAYRENISRPTYPLENRRFVPELNIRKECVENKEIPGTFDHRTHPSHRNYEYKYRKEVARNYSSTILPNYNPMQNYHFPSDCQKCPHSVKDYARRSSTSSTMPPQNPSLMKYPEQPHTQRHSSKLNYQNGSHQAPMPGTSSANIPQNSYFNPAIPREPTRESFPREFQEPNSVSRHQPPSSQMMHSSYQKYHVYQQKIAMERFSLENHLRGMARVPGYQNHPKYQECVMRYRELLRLQQNVDCQTFLQEPPKIPPTSPSAPVAPINLQFDQNGCLINSNYSHFPGIPVNPPPNPEAEASPQGQNSAMNPLENPYKPPEPLNLPRDGNLHHLRNDVPRHFQLPKNPADNFDNMIVDVDSIDPTRSLTSCTETVSTTTAPSDSNGKEFADKPQLDVRQFLANWDETEEEEGGGGNSHIQEKSLLGNVNENNQIHSPNQSHRSPQNIGNLPEEQSPNQAIDTAQSVIQSVQSVQFNQTVEQVQLNETAEAVQLNQTVESIQLNQPVEAVQLNETVEPVQLNQTVEAVQLNSAGESEASSIAEKTDNNSLKAIDDFTTTGTIVQCIQTDSSDIPTIHIVDHLPEDSELATIQTVYGDVTSLSIEQIAAAPIEIINDAQEPSETIALFGQDTGVCSKEPECSNPSEEVSAVVEEVASLESASIASKSPENLSSPTNNSPVVIQEPPPPPQEPQELVKNQPEPTTLKKQHSFASEESHNPDDISLPDLPMSECTPISTTLNTPIHSDSEESSHITDLPANPIEVVQNSPIISFTHSPLKMDPYSALEDGRISEKRSHESLDFEFTQKETVAAVENYEVARRNSSEKSSSLERSPIAAKSQQNSPENQDKRKNNHFSRQNSLDKMEKDGEFYPSSDPLMGMKKSKNSEMIDSSNDITNCSVNSLNGNAVPGTPVSRILSTDEIDTGKCPSIIDTDDFQPTSDDLDKLCNISLDSSCMMPLISADSQEPRLASIDGIKNVLPITNLNELESESEDGQKDEWVEVRSMDDEAGGVNDMIIGDNEMSGIEVMVQGEKEKSKQEMKSKRIRSIFDTSEDSQSTGFDEFTRRKQEKNKDQHISRDSKKITKIYSDISNASDVSTKNHNEQVKINDNANNNTSTIENQKIINERIEIPPPPLFDNSQINNEQSENNAVERYCSKKDTTAEKQQKQEAQKGDACKLTQSFRRTHKDTDVEIHVANIDMEKLLNSTSEAVDAIEIKINVSRHDKKLRVKSIEKVEEKIEIKNVQGYFSKIEPNHTFGKKFENNFDNKFENKFEHEFDFKFENKFETATYRPQRIFPRRRVSNPEETDSKRTKKESRRRHSGAHSYRLYRKSFEKSDKTDKINGKIAEKNSKFTLPPPKPAKTPEPSCSEEPASSSHDDSQGSVPIETTNTCASQNTEEGSALDDASLKINEPFFFPTPRTPKERLNSDFIPEFDELENLDSRQSQRSQDSLAGPSSSTDFWSKLDLPLDNTSTMDFDNFDVAPNSDIFPDDLTSSTLTEDKALSRRLEEAEKFRNPYSKAHENLEKDLDTVPVYTTRDGLIKYSPNPRFTYRALIMEARQREGYPRDFKHERHLREHMRNTRRIPRNSPSDRRKHWSDYNPTRTRGTSSRRRQEDPSWRIHCTNKYDGWREKLPELESEEISVESAQSDRFLSRKIDRFPEESRKRSRFSIEDNRNVDSLMIGSINNLTVASQSFDSKMDLTMNSKILEARIFNGDELDLLSRKDLPKDFDDAEEIDNKMEMSRESTSLRNLIDDFKDDFPDVDKLIGKSLPEKYREKSLEIFPENLNNDFGGNFEESIKENFGEGFKETFVENFKDDFPANFENDFGRDKKEEDRQKITTNLRSELSDEDTKDPKDDVMTSMRPPPSVDIEQDSQAMLTDSGLESSTTYTEGHKEPRRCSIWQRDVISDRILTPRRIEEPSKSPRILPKIIEIKTIFPEIDKTEKRVEHQKNEPLSETPKSDNETFEAREVQEVDKSELSERNVEVKQIDDKNLEKAEENFVYLERLGGNENDTEKFEEKSRENLTKFGNLFPSKNLPADHQSHFLDSLDLAFPSRKITISERLEKPTVIIEEASTSTRENSKNTEDIASRSFGVFGRQSGSLSLSKKSDVPSRRASSDEVKNRETKLSFFEQNLQFPRILNKSFLPEIKNVEQTPAIFGETSPDKTVGIFGEKSMENFSDKFGENCSMKFGEKSTRGLVRKSIKKCSEKSVEKCVEKLLGKFVGKSTVKAVGKLVQPFVMEETTTSETREILSATEDERTSTLPGEDTSQTLEHRFEKPEVPKLIHTKPFSRKIPVETSEPSTESETSQFDDTLSSTQFGSEYAASKPDDCSSGVNFLSTSSQEAIDATDLKEVRKNLASCALDDKIDSTGDQSEKIGSPKKIERSDRVLRFSSESEDDSNAQDGSPMAKILEEEEDISKTTEGDEKVLNFSGKIHSPEAVQESSDILPISHPLVPNFPTENNFLESRENPLEKLTEKSRENSPEKIIENFLEKSPGKSKEKSPEKQDDNLLTFSGKIPSPKNSADEFDILSPKISDSEEKNFTFTGRIQSEKPGNSPVPFEKIPKFIIKKTDCSSRSSSISQIFPSEVSSQRSLETSTSHRILQPKIPKMIIRNVRSRPGTPTIEENAVELSFPKAENDHRVFEVKIKLDEKATGSSPMKKSLGVIECKVPKMKIKLEDKHSKMIFENASMELHSNSTESFRNVPKVKIRKIRKPTNEDRKIDTSDKIEKKIEKFPETSRDSSFPETEKSFEKIPILKIRKTEPRIASPPSHSESSRRKRPRSPENSSRKSKKSSSRHRSSDSQSKPVIIDLDTTSSATNLSEKIPKVIIKRASSTSEFKCELSKDGGILSDSKWQPEVKLERHKVLDTIAKKQRTSRLSPELLESIMKSFVIDKRCRSSRKLQRTSSDPTRSSIDADRSSSRGRRRYSDPEKPQIDESDSEELPIIHRRSFARRIRDDSCLDLTSNSKTEFSEIVVSKIAAKSLEDVTRSDFEYPVVVSSQTEMETVVEAVVEVPMGDFVKPMDDVLEPGDTKSSEEQSVIKLDSSDESQTTIELLPAPSDISQTESEVPTPLEGERRIANGDMARLYSSDAIPTQFELELEIVDHSSGSLDVPVPEPRHSPSNVDEQWLYEPQVRPVPPAEAVSDKISTTTAGSSKGISKDPAKIDRKPEKIEKRSKGVESSRKTETPRKNHEGMCRNEEIVNIEAKSICSSDSLVKDVLAAKETLKRYLATSKATSAVARMRTPAEKKQFSEFAGSSKNESSERIGRLGFQEETATSSTVVSLKSDSSRKERKDKSKRRESQSSDGKSVRDQNIHHSSTSKGLKRHRSSSDSHDSKRMRPPSTSGTSGKSVSNRESAPRAESSADGGHKVHKSLKTSRSLERPEDKKKCTEVMPILVPEGGIAVEPSSREASRSPPIITKQDSREVEMQNQKKVDERVGEKMEEIIEAESEGMSFADIITKMAYHEKATIKHKRYCILCERWFPTTARHRRHLSGYQHRHIELTQRRTVHALFMLFTGKPCPRLLPASIVRTDCAPGEPTPLQIAVQDVAISLEKGAIDKTKQINEENK